MFAILALLATTPLASAQAFSNILLQAENNGRCLSVQGGALAQATNTIGNGTPVLRVNCDRASSWDIIQNGNGSVTAHGTNFVLDAGLQPGQNGVPLKVWQSFPGLTQQNWYYTEDGDYHIAITGGTTCADGTAQTSDGAQIWQCVNNTNQRWQHKPNYVQPQVPILQDRMFADPPAGRRLHPFNRQDLCLTVTTFPDPQSQYPNGTIGYSYCHADNDPATQWQLWTITNNANSLVQLASNAAWCLDANTNPKNNQAVSVWPCTGSPQQLWTWDDANRLITANNQCLDVQAESGRNTATNIVTESNAITWQCSTNGDIQQVTRVYNLL